MKKVLSTFLFSMLAFAASSQVLSNKEKYTEADTLRGSLRAERAYDALKYHLKLKVDPWLGLLSTQISPFMSFVSFLQIANPNPVPSNLRVLE